MSFIQEQYPLNKHLMLFDLSIHGHHPSYIQYLIEYWERHEASGKLSIVVSQQFLVEHRDVVDYTNRSTVHNVKFIAIASHEEQALVNRNSGINRNWRNFQEWQLFCTYARNLKVDHALVMYLDTYHLPIALGFRPPCATSGIYFRPTFHYPQLTGSHPSRKEQMQHLWERFLLHRVLHTPTFRNLLSLDPFVLKYINPVPAWASVLHLPDPVRLNAVPANLHDQVNQLRQQLGIEPGRTVFLMFGALTERKGIYQVLESIQYIPKELCKNICLLFVGATNASNQERINHQINELRQLYPVQIVCQHEFVPESDVPLYFHMSNVVLATYQRHVGMSGILILAAVAQKPVISSDYGLMGYLTRHHCLGLTLDSTNAEAVAQGIIQCLTDRLEHWSDSNQMKRFGDQHSAESFSKMIFEHLL